MGTTGRWIKFFVLCLAAAFIALFTVQNLSRTSDLSLNLWLVAFKLKAPQPIPYMILASFGAGVVLAGFFSSLNRLGAHRPIQPSEAQAARKSSPSPEDDWT